MAVLRSGRMSLHDLLAPDPNNEADVPCDQIDSKPLKGQYSKAGYVHSAINVVQVTKEVPARLQTLKSNESTLKSDTLKDINHFHPIKINRYLDRGPYHRYFRTV